MAGEVKIRVTADTTDVPSKLRGVVGSFTELQSQVMLAKEAVEMAGQAYDATIGQLMAYAEQVKQMKAVSGASAEEVSRLAQVFDDLGLEANDALSAMEGAARKGIVLTADNLGKLSDQYLSLQTQEEKQQFMIDNLGRAGLEYARVLELGSQKLNEMAASQAKGLILTDAQLEQTEKLRVAQDNWNDTIEASKNEISMGALPVLTDLINILMSAKESMDEDKASWLRFVPAIGAVYTATKLSNAAAEQQAKVTKQAAQGMGDLRRATEQTAPVVQQAAAALGGLSLEERDAAASAEYNAGMLESLNRVAEANKTAFDNATTAQKNFEDAQKNWQTGTAADVKQALDDAKLPADQYALALKAIDDAYGTHYTEEKNMADDIKVMTDQFKQNGQIDLYALKLGLLKDSFMPLDENIQKAKTHLQEANTELDKLNGRHVDAYVDVHIKEVQGDDGGGEVPKPKRNGPDPIGSGYASGADFEVPPGYPNDSFPMRVQSGEHVTVTPKGKGGSGMHFQGCTFQFTGVQDVNGMYQQLRSLSNIGV